MEALRLVFFCVLALLPLSLLKRYSAEQVVLLTLAVAALVVFRGVAVAVPLVKTLEKLFARTGLEGSHFDILLRTAGASLVTHLCADLCRDNGSQMLATLVETLGAIAILILALPLLETAAEILLGYF